MVVPPRLKIFDRIYYIPIQGKCNGIRVHDQNILAGLAGKLCDAWEAKMSSKVSAEHTGRR